MRFTLAALTCLTLALPVAAETTVNLSLGAVDSIETMTYTCDAAAPCACNMSTRGRTRWR